jgi:hypothetical protein
MREAASTSTYPVLALAFMIDIIIATVIPKSTDMMIATVIVTMITIIIVIMIAATIATIVKNTVINTVNTIATTVTIAVDITSTVIKINTITDRVISATTAKLTPYAQTLGFHGIG